MYTCHQLHWGFKINAIMKCGTYSTVVIMQAVYCLIGSVKKKIIMSLSTHSSGSSPLFSKAGVITHHNHLFVEFCHRAHLGVRVESGSGLTPDLSHTWPEDVLVLSWERGKHAAFDIMVTSPLIPSILTAASLLKGLQPRRLRSESIKSITKSVWSLVGCIQHTQTIFICSHLYICKCICIYRAPCTN